MVCSWQYLPLLGKEALLCLMINIRRKAGGGRFETRKFSKQMTILKTLFPWWSHHMRTLKEREGTAWSNYPSGDFFLLNRIPFLQGLQWNQQMHPRSWSWEQSVGWRVWGGEQSWDWKGRLWERSRSWLLGPRRGSYAKKHLQRRLAGFQRGAEGK